MITITSDSIEKTRNIGKNIGKYAKEGTVLAFFGDLGSGKTTLIQGIARGIGVPSEYPITSPTYTLIHEYPGRIPFYHMDLYRLKSPMDVDELGFSDIFYSRGVVAIEWAEKLNLDLLFNGYLSIEILFGTDESRIITISSKGRTEAELLTLVGNCHYC